MHARNCLAILVVVSGGCIRNEYELELKPAGKSMHRNLAVKRNSSLSDPAIEEENIRLAEVYGVEIPAIRNRNTFEGKFTRRMPDDVGGSGTFTRWETPLGSVSIYSERFRGDDDTAGMLHRQEAAARRLVDLLIGWLETELKDDARWPRLREFLDEEFRRDVINVSIYKWFQHLSELKKEPATPAVSVLQYLVEHGYLTPEEIPTIRRAFEDMGREDYRRILEWLQSQLMARMGDGSGPAPQMEFLATREQFEQSLRSFLETTDEYAEKLKMWKAELTQKPDTERPDPREVVGELLGRMLAGLFQLGGDQLAIMLHLDRPAIFTNGEWSADSSELRWPKSSLPSQDGSPLLAYAIWDEPDEEAQTSIFSQTVLAGESLLNYCLWYHGLTEAEREEWDDCLDSFRSETDRAAELKGFLFSDEPAGTKPEHRLAKPALELLLPALAP